MNHVGAACDSCDTGFIGYPSCVDDQCDLDPCNGHSDSYDSTDGSCVCSVGYGGVVCDELVDYPVRQEPSFAIYSVRDNV